MERQTKWNDKLLIARRNKDYTQRELSRLAGTNHVQISRIEKGEQMPKADMLYRLCKALNVSMDYVMEGYEETAEKELSKSK